jgi:hypothetical protein
VTATAILLVLSVDEFPKENRQQPKKKYPSERKREPGEREMKKPGKNK